MKNILKELPKVVERHGWPWDEEVDSIIYKSNVDWPKISIVTPSYNQGQYIEETIRSILLQNYPNLEYIIIDGGSHDKTLEVLKEYSPWITLWVSERDNGQAHAINKGIEKCTGDIFNWINSDDILSFNSLYNIGKSYKKHFIIMGNVANFCKENPLLNETVKNVNINFISFITFASHFHQPGIWLNLSDLGSVGNLPTQYSYYFDRFFLTEYFLFYRDIIYINETLVNFRIHKDSKTMMITKLAWPELIEYYSNIITGTKFKKYQTLLKYSLYYYLIPAQLINSWEESQKSQPNIIKFITFLLIGIKYPTIYISHYYYVIFKKVFMK